MQWVKNKKLFNELLFFYAIVNTNVQMASLIDAPNKDETFRKVITALNACVSKVIFDVIDPTTIQNMLKKETKLKKMWSSIKIEPKEPTSDGLDYYS